MSEAFRLDGARIVVTGGRGLIGSAIVRAFSATGAKVTVVDQGGDDAAVDQGVAFFAADLASVAELTDVVADIDASSSGVDVWVNCHYPRTDDWGAPAEAFGPETWAANVQMQMTSYCVISSEIAKRMAERSGGCLINVASIYGLVGPDFSIYDDLDMTTPPPYSAIKGGVIAYSRYLATQWGPKGVRVNSVCPGGVSNAQPVRFVEAYSRRTPLRRLAEPAEVAGPVVFLASPAAAYITGATIPVDGGWTAQ